MTTDKPVFRFYPGAYDDGVLVASDETCASCGQRCGWAYTGLVYARVEVGATCARCLAAGTIDLGSDPHGYALHDILLESVPDDLLDEVERRTPGVSCFNPFDWPVHDGAPMVFLGHGESKALWRDPDLQAAMKAAWHELTGDELTGPTSYLLVFRSLDGTHTTAVLDLD